MSYLLLSKPIEGKNLEEFRKAIKLELLSRDMNYRQLARQIGFSLKTVYNNMCGNSMSKFVGSAIAEALCIDISDYEEGVKDGRAEE